MKPKILLLDIETAPSLGYVWGKWEQNVLAFEKEWYMLSYAYKWLDEKTTHVNGLPDYSGYSKDPENDLKLVQDLRSLMNEADIIVAHNGDRFDIPKINARMLAHGMIPPRPYKTVDTLKVARAKFSMTSNKLDDIAQYLNIGSKLSHTGFKLWRDCMSGDLEAWALMKKYNKQDVVLLEKVYLTLRPWMTNHPNVNVYDEVANACPSCGGEKMLKRGFGYTNVSSFQRYQCKECGAWSRGSLIRTDLVIR